MHVIILFVGEGSQVPHRTYGPFTSYDAGCDFVEKMRPEWDSKYDYWTFVAQEITAP